MIETFHYGFDMTDTEKILHKALVNMEDGDIVANGALYLTNERMVFVGYVLNTRTRVSCDVSLYHIKEVRPEKTFYVFNNIIRIISIRDEQFKFIVDRRSEWLEQIHKQLRAIE